MNSHLYQLYWFLSNGEFQDFYGFPDYLINMQDVFGANYEVLSSSKTSLLAQQALLTLLVLLIKHQV
jgi:hypothetical protein